MKWKISDAEYKRRVEALEEKLMEKNLDAAGALAALAVKRDTRPRELDPKEVIKALIKQEFDKLKH